MRERRRLSRRPLLATVAACVAMAACSQARPPTLPASDPAQAAANSGHSTPLRYRHLYRFTGGSDGGHPQSTLTEAHGMLYGSSRGYSGARCLAYGCYPVFALSITGKPLTVLHTFDGSHNVGHPQAISYLDGALYGTTGEHHAQCSVINTCGAIFKIDSSGTYTLEFAFNGLDGDEPADEPLIAANGIIYGTTAAGGGSSACAERGCGTVYAFNPTHKSLHVLHAFTGGADGSRPGSGLIDVNGALYGVTSDGGTGCGNRGCGTVFSVDIATGKESVVYDFKGGSDGAAPSAGLLYADGALWGTTRIGGTMCNAAYADGCGTVFKLTMSGEETVIHRFQGGVDGSEPTTGLVELNGTFYGTLMNGGPKDLGTIYQVDASGAKSTVYAFSGGSDGYAPKAGLVKADGVLYGTTAYGGGITSRDCKTRTTIGCGIVFSLKPQ